MNRILFIATAFFFSLPLFSQEGEEAYFSRGESKKYHTLLNNDNGVGGYGALSMGYTSIEGRNGLVLGGRGEWIIGHSLGIGAGGYAFINEPRQSLFNNVYYNLVGGYGGFIIEPIVLSHWPVHLAFPVLLGAGGVALTSYTEDLYRQPEPYDVYYEEASAFLVAEPGAELEFNLVRWIRLSFYGKYRFTTNLMMTDTGPQALTGWSSGVTLKIGIF